MTKNFKEYLAEDRRLAILRFLAEDTDYSLNDSVIRDALDSIGHSASRDVIRADLAFLQEVGTLTYEVPMDGLYVAKLTAKGEDVALGRSIVPGIKRPSPK